MFLGCLARNGWWPWDKQSTHARRNTNFFRGFSILSFVLEWNSWKSGNDDDDASGQPTSVTTNEKPLCIRKIWPSRRFQQSRLRFFNRRLGRQTQCIVLTHVMCIRKSAQQPKTICMHCIHGAVKTHGLCQKKVTIATNLAAVYSSPVLLYVFNSNIILSLCTNKILHHLGAADGPHRRRSFSNQKDNTALSLILYCIAVIANRRRSLSSRSYSRLTTSPWNCFFWSCS